MMLTLFEKILLGHLIGDYILQSKKMAIAKSVKGWDGLKWCLIHCIIYTTIICLFTATSSPLKILLIFMSHFPIDRWSLASWWLKIIKGRDLITAYKSKAKFHELDLSFSVITYVVVDNTMHLLLMLIIFNYL